MSKHRIDCFVFLSLLLLQARCMATLSLYREMEWMFSTSEGRMELQRSAGYERLLVVTLHREHTYESLESVKSELSGKVMELAPPNVAKQVW